MKQTKNNLMFLTAMLIWGSLGVFVTNVTLSSQAIVMWRTIIGSVAIGTAMLFARVKIDWASVKKNLIFLIILGACMAASWVCLFEAYRWTTVGTATLMYYSAPILVFALSPLIFKEKMTLKKIVGMAVAIVGMVVINSVASNGVNDARGIFFALLSAVTYALIMILSKFVKDLSGVQTSFFQLLFASVFMIAYNAATIGFAPCVPLSQDIPFILILGIVHTGLAIYLYFTSLKTIPTQSASILSYIDPASALVFSALFLGESMTLLQLCGALLILGGTLFASVKLKKRD
ncbi:MAG: DMT family transporter [Clostridia bacterium]